MGGKPRVVRFKKTHKTKNLRNTTTYLVKQGSLDASGDPLVGDAVQAEPQHGLGHSVRLHVHPRHKGVQGLGDPSACWVGHGKHTDE